jgi:hypothetical protein
VQRALWWWYGLSLIPAAVIGGVAAGHTGAAVGVVSALLVNGAIIAAYEYWYPPTRIP